MPYLHYRGVRRDPDFGTFDFDIIRRNPKILLGYSDGATASLAPHTGVPGSSLSMVHCTAGIYRLHA